MKLRVSYTIVDQPHYLDIECYSYTLTAYHSGKAHLMIYLLKIREKNGIPTSYETLVREIISDFIMVEVLPQ